MKEIKKIDKNSLARMSEFFHVVVGFVFGTLVETTNILNRLLQKAFSD